MSRESDRRAMAAADAEDEPTRRAIPCASGDRAHAHAWSVLAHIPAAPRARLFWVPALGVAAKHYSAFAEALAAHGVAVFVHEWRGLGSSTWRAGHERDWGYRELLIDDLPRSDAAMRAALAELPTVYGGHSLGGQLAACHLALSAQSAQALWLVASGAPFWRTFPAPFAWALPLIYRFIPWLSDRYGALPGRRIGFGGNEARTVMRDWTRTGLSGRYAAAGIAEDIEAALRRVDTRVQAVRLRDDWLVPQASLDFLVAKMPKTRFATRVLDRNALGAPADHFAWIRYPHAVAETLIESL